MKLLLKYLSMHLKVALEYKLSFILSSFAQGLVMLAEFFTVYSLFSKFKLLDTYNIYELFLGFAVIWLGFSLAEIFGRGFDCFPKLIKTGNFDLLLIRPVNLFLQIIGSDIYYERISRVLSSMALLVYSAIKLIDVFTIDKILLLILMVIGCTIIILSLFIIGATFSFYTIEGLEAANVLTYGTKQASEYPLGIYKKIVRNIFTFIIPIGLVNYYPLEYLSGSKDNILYLFMPLSSIIFFIISLLIFRIGLKKYASTGS